MYFIVICIRLYISWCSHGRLWELQLSVFSLTTHLALYHATLTIVLTNRNCSLG